ncbi:MAG: hypothetical protein KatS3mg119_0974 [Rhodothalassiaceae bacterium]|nr:MAG: hypothetical protein KatS3mg119_0974 [Rhodothalassiaceae bacterium]
MMTMPVSEKDLLEAGENALAACPHLFQEEIRKDFELRIVVVGSRVFPFRIDSQKKKLTQFDWRYGHFLLEFTECRIPEKVETSLKRFLKAWNLLSGSFDLIVDKLGQFWFLECNQDGAWGWLDEIVGGGDIRCIRNDFL